MDLTVGKSTNDIASPCLNLCPFSDHRWTYHSERIQPADFENAAVNHLTELQSVSPQQLLQPYRCSGESLPLHLDQALTPLSVAAQVSQCVALIWTQSYDKQHSLNVEVLKNTCIHESSA